MEITETQSLFMNPVIQYGFAGFCVVLIGIIVWLIGRLLQVLNDNNNIISANTMAIREVAKNSADARDVAIEAKELLLQRPCVARFDVQRVKQG